MADGLQFLLNGLAFGSIIVLAAIGLTLVYGVLRLPNFAHGDLVAVGAYGAFAFTVLVPPGQALALAGLAALALLGLGLAGPRARRRGRMVLEPSEGRALRLAGLFLLALAAGVAAPPAPGLGAPALAGGLALAVASGLALHRGWAPWPAARAALPAALALGLGLAVWSASSPYWLGTALAAATGVNLALALEFLVWRRLRARRATVVTMLIVSIGVAFVLRASLGLGFGTDFLNYQRPLELPWLLGGVLATSDQLATIALAAALVGGVHLLLAATRTGKALRALADDPDLARVSGVDVDRLTVVLWALVAALAAVAGAMLPLNHFNVSPDAGALLLLVMFAAVILGGIGSPYGAMVGGLAVGVAMELAAGLWRPEYKFAVGFAILVAMLLVRPQGLLGGRAA